LLFHCVGTMLGKAEYNDYFVALQDATIGSHKGNYPKMGIGVSMTAHSSLISNCTIGDRVSISAYTNLFQQDLSDNSVVFRDNLGQTIIRKIENCYAQQFFKEII
jgi:serine O-acetyltransferase